MNIAQTGSQFAFDDYLRANGNVTVVDINYTRRANEAVVGCNNPKAGNHDNNE
jgi:hypothetical protein